MTEERKQELIKRYMKGEDLSQLEKDFKTSSIELSRLIGSQPDSMDILNARREVQRRLYERKEKKTEEKKSKKLERMIQEYISGEKTLEEIAVKNNMTVASLKAVIYRNPNIEEYMNARKENRQNRSKEIANRKKLYKYLMEYIKHNEIPVGSIAEEIAKKKGVSIGEFTAIIEEILSSQSENSIEGDERE